MSSRSTHNLHRANSGSPSRNSNTNDQPSGTSAGHSNRGHPQTRKHRRALTDDDYVNDPQDQDESDEAESNPRAYKIPRVETAQLLQSMNKTDKKDRPVSLPVDEDVLEMTRDAVRLSKFDYKTIFVEEGYTALADAAYAGTKKADHPFFSKKNKRLVKLKTWRKTSVDILASIPRPLLKAVFDGSLPHKILSDQVQEICSLFDTTDEDLANHHTWSLRQLAKFAPNIYTQFHVDKKGHAMESFKIRIVIQKMREYMSGDPEFHNQNAGIDGQTREKNDRDRIERGLHYYLDGSQNRVEVALVFSFALEAYLDKVAPVGSMEEDTPLTCPLVYFGFSVCFVDRIKQHSNGNTNWLGALFNDICKTLFIDDDGNPEFSFATWVIAYLANYKECQIGEELFTRAGCGYYYTGQGFNIAPAGIAVTSANLDDHNFTTATRLWKTCLKYRTKNPDFECNLEEEEDLYLPEYKERGITERQERVDRRLQKEKRKEQKQQYLDLKEELRALKKAIIPRERIRQLFQELQEEIRLTEDAVHADPHLKAIFQVYHQKILSDHQPAVDRICRSSPEI